MPVETNFNTARTGLPVGRAGTVGVKLGKVNVSNTTELTLFKLPYRARPILWVWQVEDAFNGTSPTVTVNVDGSAGVTISSTNVTTTGDKFVFVGTAFYPTTDYGFTAEKTISAIFAASGSPTTGNGWVKCLYILD